MLCFTLHHDYLGSPPQVRGKLLIPMGVRGMTRITPAGAGKTLQPCIKSPMCRDHPRRCGENRLCSLRLPCILGSPPQVRGKHVHGFPSSRFARITPAGAGKTKMQ